MEIFLCQVHLVSQKLSSLLCKGKEKERKEKEKERKEKERKEKEREGKERKEKKRNEKIPDPQNCFGGVAIEQSPQIVWGGGGYPTLISIQQ